MRSLDGSRRWPPGVPLLALLSGVMRSICDDDNPDESGPAVPPPDAAHRREPCARRR
jgi:hypothetical protein